MAVLTRPAISTLPEWAAQAALTFGVVEAFFVGAAEYPVGYHRLIPPYSALFPALFRLIPRGALEHPDSAPPTPRGADQTQPFQMGQVIPEGSIGRRILELGANAAEGEIRTR